MADSWGGSWGTSWGGSWGSGIPIGQVVTFFRGVSRAPGHQGVSRPIVHLTSVGGGLYDVAIISGVSNTKDDAVSDETYLVDGAPV